MPVTFEPATQPTNVGTGGTTVEIDPPSTRDNFRIDRIVVVKTAGSAALYDVEVGTKKEADDTILDQFIVAEWVDASDSDPVDDDNGGDGFVWEPEDTSGGKLFVRIVPDAGADNDFHVRIYIVPEV